MKRIMARNPVASEEEEPMAMITPKKRVVALRGEHQPSPLSSK